MTLDLKLEVDDDWLCVDLDPGPLVVVGGGKESCNEADNAAVVG